MRSGTQADDGAEERGNVSAKSTCSRSNQGVRAWVTPLTIGAFLLIGVTGLLMFFKVRGGLIVIVHEWLSLVFVVVAALHTWLNWGAVRAHLSRARGIVVVGSFAGLLVLSLLPVEEVSEIARAHGHGQEELGRRAAEALLGARVSTVAELTGCTSEQVREGLARNGVVVDSDQLTLAEVARQSDAHPARVLEVALQAGAR